MALGFNKKAAQKSLQARRGLHETLGQSDLTIDGGQTQEVGQKSNGAIGR